MRIRQRRFLNISGNIGFVATVSLWPLKVAGVSLAVLFHQDGISPHRIGSKSRFPFFSIIASIVVVGAMLKCGCKFGPPGDKL
jgi:hypothetical protein